MTTISFNRLFSSNRTSYVSSWDAGLSDELVCHFGSMRASFLENIINNMCVPIFVYFSLCWEIIQEFVIESTMTAAIGICRGVENCIEGELRIDVIQVWHENVGQQTPKNFSPIHCTGPSVYAPMSICIISYFRSMQWQAECFVVDNQACCS